MQGGKRRVRQVRLGAASRDMVRRGALLLEDALATASLPWADGGRLLLVRRLDVGTIHADRSPASLALQFERRLRRLRSVAVLAGRRGAEGQDAVFFRSPVEALIELARRLAGGGDLSGWFWRPAVPAWDPAQPPDRALPALLQAALGEPGGAVVAARMTAALAADGALEPLLSRLTEADGRRLAGELPGRAAGCAPPPEAPPRAAETAAAAPAAVWVTRWGAADPRSLWLVASLLVADSPTLAADPRLPARTASLARRLAPRLAAAGPAAAAAGGGEDRRPPADPRVDHSTAAGEAPGLAVERPAAGAATAPRPAAVDGADAVAEPEVMPAPVTWTATTVRTELGGLLFLLPVLDRLGLETFLDDHPRLAGCHLPQRLLLALAARLPATADDPLLEALAPPDDSPWPRRIRFAVPAVWRHGLAARGATRLWRGSPDSTLTDASGRLVLGRWRRRPPAAAEIWRRRARPGGRSRIALDQDDRTLLLSAWLTAARRWCRRAARIGLADLVLRRAALAAGDTHLDLLFDHRLADSRVRRAGLDLDPGWVADLARVVQFHYVHEEVA